jgi:hypothetical protein
MYLYSPLKNGGEVVSLKPAARPLPLRMITGTHCC